MRPGNAINPALHCGWLCLAVAGCFIASGCSKSTVSASPDIGPRPAPQTLYMPHIRGVHNVHLVCDGILSGSQPEDNEAFTDLARHGIKTIVSVDGARPHVAGAKRAGLLYVHIPLGYDGVDERSILAIGRVIKERPGPYFFHCHHGKHRGPAAAAIAALSAGKMDVTSALRYLTRAGTGAEYAGLWRDVEQFQPLSAEATPPELVEIAQVKSLTAAMVEIDRIVERLKLCETADWTTPPGHADVTARHEALLLKEAFQESSRQLEKGADEQLRAELDDAAKLASTLEEAVITGKTHVATATFANVQAACTNCHAKHRN